MALDSKQKRGSLFNWTMPFRSWLAEPDSTIDTGDRLSLMKHSSSNPPVASVGVPPIFFGYRQRRVG